MNPERQRQDRARPASFWTVICLDWRLSSIRSSYRKRWTYRAQSV